MTQPLDALLAEMRAKRKLPPVAQRRRIREAAGCSMRQAADACGVSVMAISRWEHGSTPRDPQHVATYGRLLEELGRLAAA